MTYIYIYIYIYIYSIADHMINKCDRFSILSRSHLLYHIKVLETLYVRSLQPSLFKQRDCLLGVECNRSLTFCSSLLLPPPFFSLLFFFSITFPFSNCYCQLIKKCQSKPAVSSFLTINMPTNSLNLCLLGHQ